MTHEEGEERGRREDGEGLRLNKSSTQSGPHARASCKSTHRDRFMVIYWIGPVRV